MKDDFKNNLRGEFRGDFSRSTFQREKRYSSVRLQQGRVQLDADWNEQVDIQAYRDYLTARDVVGVCGAPLHDAGFALSVSADGKLQIGAGRYYVNGILCENDDENLDLIAQPDLPGESLPTTPGKYIAYLDVWQRHVTAVEDPSIREVALDGPDTATRTRTAWQVKLQEVASNANCAQFDDNWTPDDPQSKGRLRARAQPEGTNDTPCVVPPGAGYRRLENQLYRVEIHDGGEPYGAPRSSGAEETVVESVASSPTEVEVADEERAWQADQWIELFDSGSSAPGTLRRIVKVDNNTLTLNEDIPVGVTQPNRLRRVATYKFSRDNGAMLAKLENTTGNFVTVSAPGKDPTLGFAGEQWVELGDERRALRGEPGVLLQLTLVSGNDLEVRWPNNTPLTMGNFSTHNGTPPTVRRWDCKEGPIPVIVATSPTTENWQELEDGVEVEFEAGTYRTGDYWLIPARTLTGNVEWPQSAPDAQNETKPLFETRHGVEHHYCPLALLELSNNAWKATDCRKLFPPSTELSPLYYVSGDGQEAMPDPTQPQSPTQFVPLSAPLQAGVANRVGAKVRFRITEGKGRLDGSEEEMNPCVILPTGVDGIASCNWELDSSTEIQQVEAHLLDEADNPLPLPVRFNANLSIASQVAYDPGTCDKLSGANTVQKAIERLSNLSNLYYVSGDGQEVMPADRRQLKPLQVLVANRCGPVEGAKVVFEVIDGGGQVNDGGQLRQLSEVSTNEDGIASCNWIPGPSEPTQRAKARLLSAPDPNLIHEPLTVYFTAHLNVAGNVTYEPPADCPPFTGISASTVKDALDALCRVESGGRCSIAVGEGGRYETLRDALGALREQNEIRICLLPGDHDLFDGLLISNHTNVEITGYTPGARVFLGENGMVVDSLTRFTLRNVEIRSDNAERALTFARCDEVRVEFCYLTGIVPEEAAALLTIAGSDRIHLANNSIAALSAWLEPSSMVSPSTVFVDVDERSRELFDENSYERFDRRKFEDRASEVARHFSGLSQEEREELAQRIRSQVGSVREEMGLSPEELESYERFARTIETDRGNIRLDVELFWRSLLQRLTGILDAASSPSPLTAVIIEDAAAETILENNHVVGAVSLYGEPGTTRLDPQELSIVGRMLRPGQHTTQFSLSRSAGVLRVLNNNLTRLTTAEAKVLKLKELDPGSGGRMDGVYGRSFVDNNTIASEDNLLLSHHLSFNSNVFDARAEGDVKTVGTVIADVAVLVGNTASDPRVTLHSATRSNEKVANLELNIIDH